jgi:hypothetical protein
MLHVRTGTGRGKTVTSAIYSRYPLCPLGEDEQLVLGGMIDPPQRLHSPSQRHKGKAYLGATGEGICILTLVVSHPSHTLVVAEWSLMLLTTLGAFVLRQDRACARRGGAVACQTRCDVPSSHRRRRTLISH